MKKLLYLIIVTWTASYYQYKPCKDEPIINPYTGEVDNLSVNPDNLCGGFKGKDMRREFKTLEEAKQFMADCPAGQCSNIKYQEVKE